jgi:RNA 2',3'-cyclic 3'-phosphodiesterase
VRLFAGIALSREVKQAVVSFVDGLRAESPRLRWSDPEQWHITLHFLGETDEAHYGCVMERLQTVSAQAVEIKLGSPDFFERAKIFHIAVQVTETLRHLHREAGEALSHCGFQPEARPYAPHITLARNKGGAPSSDFKLLRQAVQKAPPPNLPAFTAHEFLLYQSFTESSGSRHEVRGHFSLR